MLTYRRTDNLAVECYTDADFAGDEDDRKSTSGYVYMLAGGAVSWRSHKQGVTVASTMQAEFVSCYDATGRRCGLRILFRDLRLLIVSQDLSKCTAITGLQSFLR
jgi:hypothetical protein